MRNRQHEAETLLHDAIDRHQCEFVGSMVTAVNSQFDAFSKANTKLVEAEPYFGQLRQYAEKVCRQYRRRESNATHHNTSHHITPHHQSSVLIRSVAKTRLYVN